MSPVTNTQLVDKSGLKLNTRGRDNGKKKTNNRAKKRDRSQTASMGDGRPIDIVLSYKPMDAPKTKRAIYAKYRRKFENELRAQGLELEYESKDMSRDGRTAYVKIHAPFDVLARQAEMRALRKPTQPSDLPNNDTANNNICYRLLKRIFHDPFRLQDNLEYPVGDYFTEPFRRKTQENFMASGFYGGETFFTASERAWLTWDSMRNVQTEVKQKRGVVKGPLIEIGKVAADPNSKYGKARRPSQLPRLTSEEPRKVEMPGTLRVTIDYLLEINVYEAAYPLHDCDLFDEQQYRAHKQKSSTKWPLRMYLYEAWVRPSQLFRHQPLDAIRDYFGERVALYFAWLGFYTMMLIAPAIVGTIVLIHGGASVGDDELSEQYCHNDTLGQFVVCRSCPYEHCDFKYIKAFCTMARFEGVFDNELTVPFSLFTALWAVLLLACWKRYRAELMTRWNICEPVDDEEAEPIKAQYEMTTTGRIRNPVTGKYEYDPSKRAGFKKLMAALVSVMFCLFVVLGFIIAVMVYRIFGPHWWLQVLGDDEENADYGLIISVTTSFANGIFIGIMSKLYRFLAVYLTKAENPRTETEFERSYSRKVAVFEWLNYFGTLLYSAFVQGQVISAPHEQSLWEMHCPITGCLTDVVIRLAVVYIGKQMFDTFVTIAAPIARVCISNIVNTVRRKNTKDVRWEEDHELSQTPSMFLFAEYLRLFIQYCFVTMFVPAFPVAPLFALINNVLEIRLDAYRILVLTRRTAPVPLRHLGPWDNSIKVVTRLALLTNALLIALTTDFVPRIVYRFGYSPDYTLQGYAQHVLSEFNTSDWSDPHLANWHSSNNTVHKCFYRDYRVSPWGTDRHRIPPYARKEVWWHVLVTRMAFILVFEHSIFLLQSLIEYLIPIVPSRILRRQKREQHLQRERFMQREGEKMKRKKRKEQ